MSFHFFRIVDWRLNGYGWLVVGGYLRLVIKRRFVYGFISGSSVGSVGSVGSLGSVDIWDSRNDRSDGNIWSRWLWNSFRGERYLIRRTACSALILALVCDGLKR